MPRAELIIAVDRPDEVATAEAWFLRWRPELTRVSDNQGCGCCVDIFTVEGSETAIAALPGAIHACTPSS